MNRGTIGEILGAGTWAASGVAVAGYTFKAFSATYQQFPSPGGGFGSPAQGALDIAGAVAGLPAGAKPDKAGSFKTTQPGSAGIGGGIINWFTNKLGITSPPDQTVPTKSRPPRPQERALQAAVNNGNRKQVISLMNTVATQQKARGWTAADFKAWVDSRPWGQKAWNIMAGLQ